MDTGGTELVAGLHAALEERRKELQLLHRAALLLLDGKRPPAAVFEQLVELIPPAFFEPERARARLRLGERVICQPDFPAHAPQLRGRFLLPGNQAGFVEVAYLPEGDPPPDFLPEEQELLNSLARLLEASLQLQEDSRRLEDSQRRLHALFDNDMDCVKVMDAECRVVEINPAGRRLLGCAEDALAGASLDAFIHPDDLAEYRRLHECAMQGRTERGCYRVVTSTGTVRYLESICMPLTGEHGGRQALSITKDLTRVQRQEEKFRHLLDSSPDAMVITDAAGRIRIINRACETSFGYTREELIGQAVEMLIPESLREAHRARRENYSYSPVLRPMGMGMNLRGRRKDGSEFPVEIALGPIEADDETLICATVRDLTGTREFEIALREMANTVAFHTGNAYFCELAKYLSQRFGLHSVIIGRIDDNTGAVHTLTAASAGVLIENFTHSLQHAPCAKLNHREACIFKDDVQKLFPQDAWFREQNARGYAGIRLITPDGAVAGIIAAISLQPLHNVSVIESFFKLASARAAAELDRLRQNETIEQSETRYRLAESGTADGLWDQNLLTGKVYFSPRFAQLLGLTLAELGDDAKEFWRRLHPDDHAPTREALARHLERDEAFDVQYRLRHADGHYRWFRVRGMATRDASGKPLRFTGGLSDITIGKRQQLQLAVENLWLKKVAEGVNPQALLRAIADNAPSVFEDCLLHVCVQTHGDLPVCYTAPRQQDLFGETAQSFAQLAGIEREVSSGASEWCKHEDVSGYDAAWIKPVPLDDERQKIFFVVLYPPGQRIQAHERRFVDSATRMLQLLVTQLRISEEAARQRLLFRNLFESTPEAMVILDGEDHVLDVNPQFTELFQYQPDEVRGRSLNELIMPQEFAEEGNRLSEKALAGGMVNSESFRCRKDGTLVPVSILGAPFTVQNTSARYFAVYRDQRRLHEFEKRLEYQNRHDILTGLPNRYEFERRLNQSIRLSSEGSARLSVLYFDLDQFKVVNDTIGHRAGDRLLQEITRRLAPQIKAPSVFARLGGDEFAILLINTSHGEAEVFAQSIRNTLASQPVTVEERMFNITASFGVVEVGQEFAENAQDILSLADSACFLAKERGRNRIQSYHPEDLGAAQRRSEMDWVARLNQALAEDRFVLYHQKIALIGSDGGAEHSELLLRLLDDKGNNVPPAMFIPPAERYNLMPRIDRWVLKRALSEMAARGADWQRAHHISVNISGGTLSDDGLTDYIAKLFEQYAVLPGAVCFEITETAAIANFDDALRFIELVRKLGCEVALDDFGSGLSSFRYLKEIAPDYLKIDGSFIREIVNNRTDRSVVEAINRLGKIIGIRTVAEFVEDAATVAILREIGVDYAQGYGIHRPEPWDSAV